MINDKTIYTIRDENGEKTTITLEKLVADVLQIDLHDVHAWVQSTYNKVANERPKLGRRQKGNIVRELAIRMAEKSQHYKGLLNGLLGI